jgi:serine/threonine protein kinase
VYVGYFVVHIRPDSSLVHKHIVRYLGTDVIDNTLYIFTEWVSGGSLEKMLEQFPKLPEKVISKYTLQILIGLQYLHDHNVVHRDIKVCVCVSMCASLQSIVRHIAVAIASAAASACAALAFPSVARTKHRPRYIYTHCFRAPSRLSQHAMIPPLSYATTRVRTSWWMIAAL